MTNKLRDELASIICFADGVHPDAIKCRFPETYYWQDYIPHAQAIIDYLAPTMRGVVGALQLTLDDADGFELNMGNYSHDSVHDINNAYVSLFQGIEQAIALLRTWQEKVE